MSPVLQKKTPQNKIVEAVLLLIIAILAYWFMIGPKRTAMEAVTTQAETLHKQETDLNTVKSKLNQAIADLKNHPKEVAEMDEALPLDNRVTKLYIVLNDLTQNSGMAVGNISVSYKGSSEMAGNKALLANPYGATRSVQKLTTSLTAVGSFDQFQALLEKIQNSGRLINITAVSVAAGQAGAFNFTLNLEAYYYAQ